MGNIRSMLEPQECPIYRDTFLEIKLKKFQELSFKDFSLALLDDCKSGAFRNYENPVLKTNFESILMIEHERTFVLEEINLGRDYSGKLLDELRDYVSRGVCEVRYFRIGDNWTGKMDFDIVGFFHSDMEKNYPRLLLNKGTKTYHLSPFLDAEVIDGKLCFNHKGEQIEEKL